MEGPQSVYSMMQTGEPIARYKKTILGKVHVVVLNEFSDEPEEIVLQGNPDKKSNLEEIIIETWTDKADVFFRRVNRAHFDAGRLIELEEAPEPPEKSPNAVTDSELEEILNMKFLALKARLNKFTTEAPVLRMLNKAREMEKSEKLIGHIEERLSEIQLNQLEDDEEEDEE